MSYPFGIVSETKEAWQSRTEPESMRLLAHVYWNALILFVAFVAVASGVLGVYEFNTTEAPYDSVTLGSGTGPSFSREALESTLQLFSDKQSQYQSLTNAPGSVPQDPSQ